MPDTVRITLREPNAPTVVLTIADAVPNSGSYQWLVPASVAPGQYRIRVKVKDAPILDDSEVFHVAAALTPGDLGAKTKVQEKPPFKAAVAQVATNIKTVPAQCTTWVKFLPKYAPNEIFWARPVPHPNISIVKYAEVGYDHFPQAGAWFAKVWRAKVYFFIEDLANNVYLRDRLIEAKMKFKQIESIRTNTNHASCATGMGVLHAMWTEWSNPPVAHMVGLSFFSTEYSVDVTETVRNWLKRSEVNYGFLLVSEKEDLIQENITCISCYEISLVLKFQED